MNWWFIFDPEKFLSLLIAQQGNDTWLLSLKTNLISTKLKFNWDKNLRSAKIGNYSKTK